GHRVALRPRIVPVVAAELDARDVAEAPGRSEGEVLGAALQVVGADRGPRVFSIVRARAVAVAPAAAGIERRGGRVAVIAVVHLVRPARGREDDGGSKGREGEGTSHGCAQRLAAGTSTRTENGARPRFVNSGLSDVCAPPRRSM